MAESVVLQTQPRQGRGTQAARRLRRQGLIPAVVYGHKQATIAVALNGEEFSSAVRHGQRVVDLKLDGATERALIQELQWDHLGKEILHVDFRRVSEHERVQVPVPVEVRGIAPGVTAGGILDQPLYVLEVECEVTAVPDSIRVNINELQIDQAIYVKDLHLPPGVKVIGDPDAIVIHVTAPKAEAEAPAAAAAPAAAEQAEPEVIGRQRAEEEEEEKK
jgi:large subunit ribosomal protein L25